MGSVGGDDPAELLAVVDEEDRLLEYRARAECHSDAALIHRSVHVVVDTPYGRLFQRRGPGKDKGPGLWDSACSGHVERDEAREATARRELIEELGLSDVEPAFVGTTLVDGIGETELCGVFHLVHGGPFRLAPPELVALAVVPDGELPGPLTPAAAQVLAWLSLRVTGRVAPGRRPA
ncbi:MAG: NUDIX domain-containing protein [Gaiellales bacterium]